MVFNEVLMLSGGGEDLRIGAPLVDGVQVVGEVLSQTKGPKITIFKMKRRKGFRKKTGHRQPLTKLKLRRFLLSGGGDYGIKKGREARETAGTAKPSVGASRPTAATVNAGSIIVRQLKSIKKCIPAITSGLGKDYTIFSKIDGIVKFERKDKTRKKVSVYAA